MPTVIFEPGGQRIEVPAGLPLLKAILRAGRPIGYGCRGAGLCVACRVRVRGEIAAPGPAEAAQLARLDHPAGYRLACLSRVDGDLWVRADYW